MLCQTRRELEHDKQYVDEVVEKYAPGSREFDHWIAYSAELSSRLDIHKGYCVFCREEFAPLIARRGERTG
jgi:hypothetical protein